MAKIHLREKSGPPLLGHNMHILKGHQRLDFVKANYVPGRILDAGCGEGAFAIWHLNQHDSAVHAIDIHEVVFPKGILFKQMPIENYKWPGVDFTTILLMEIIEHIEDPEGVIANLYKCLALKGRMLITTPWVDTWDWEEDHIWRWDKRSFGNLMRPYGGTTMQDDIFLYGVIIKHDQ